MLCWVMSHAQPFGGLEPVGHLQTQQFKGTLALFSFHFEALSSDQTWACNSRRAAPPLLWEKWLLSSSPPKGPLSNSRSIWQKRRHRSHHRPPLRVGGQLKLLQRTLALLACMSGPVYQPPMMEIKTCDPVHERFFPSQNKSQISTSVYSLSVGRDRAVPASYHRPLLSPPPGQVL